MASRLSNGLLASWIDFHGFRLCGLQLVSWPRRPLKPRFGVCYGRLPPGKAAFSSLTIQIIEILPWDGSICRGTVYTLSPRGPGPRLTKRESRVCKPLQFHPSCIRAASGRRNGHESIRCVPDRRDASSKRDYPSPWSNHTCTSHLSYDTPRYLHAEGCFLVLDMRSYDFHRLLVIRFLLWSPNPWDRVGKKRRQLRYGDLLVHSLLWDIQVLHLRFPMFVLPLMHSTKFHDLTACSGGSSHCLATGPSLATSTMQTLCRVRYGPLWVLWNCWSAILR